MSKGQAELFKVDPSVCPMVAFIAEHEIKSVFDSGMVKGFQWGAYFGNLDQYLRFDEILDAATEMDAMFLLAKKHNLKGWDTLNWG